METITITKAEYTNLMARNSDWLISALQTCSEDMKESILKELEEVGNKLTQLYNINN